MMKLLGFLLLTLFAVIVNGQHPGMQELPKVKSPLHAIDPPELDILRNYSFPISFTTSTTNNNANFLMNWADETIGIAPNRRYWLTYYSHEEMPSDVHIAPNRSACVYDVSANNHFQKLSQVPEWKPNTQSLVVLQCPIGECMDDDIGCGKPSFNWGRTLALFGISISFLFLFMVRSNSFIYRYLKQKLSQHGPVHTEAPEAMGA